MLPLLSRRPSDVTCSVSGSSIILSGFVSSRRLQSWPVKMYTRLLADHKGKEIKEGIVVWEAPKAKHFPFQVLPKIRFGPVEVKIPSISQTILQEKPDWGY